MTTTTRSGGGRSGARAGLGRLFLLTALLFGIVTMHTLGHPTGHASGEVTGATHLGHARVADDGTHARVADDGMHARVGDENGGAQPLPAAGPGGTSSHGLDPMAVCLAVLGGFTLLVLLAGVLRPLALALPTPGLARLAHAHRPNPPPPRTLLSHLSVLRI